MSIYNVIEYSDNYLKTSGILWQFYRDVPAVGDDGLIIDFNENNATTRLFNLKVKRTGEAGDNGTKNTEIMIPLKYLSNFWRTVEMPLINCEINLDLNWSKNYIIATNNANQTTAFSIIDTKLYFPVATLSTQDSAKQLKQLKPSFKKTINCNK